MEGEVAHWDKVVSTKGKSQMYISLFEKICSSVSEGLWRAFGFCFRGEYLRATKWFEQSQQHHAG